VYFIQPVCLGASPLLAFHKDLFLRLYYYYSLYSILLRRHCVHLVQRHHVRRGGAVVETMTFNRRVVGSTPALAPRRNLEQVLYLQLSVRFGVKFR